MELPIMLYDLTRSEKSKMASFKPELPISLLVDNIGTKFQRLYPNVFGVRQHGETSGNAVRCLGMLEIKDGGLKPEVEMT